MKAIKTLGERIKSIFFRPKATTTFDKVEKPKGPVQSDMFQSFIDKLQ